MGGKAVGRPRENWRIDGINRLEEVTKFVEKVKDHVDDFAEKMVVNVAEMMMSPTGKESGVRSMKKLASRWIPRDTGRLVCVFGAIGGVPNTELIRDPARAAAKSPKPYEEDVIWEKTGRFQIDMGTSLYYAAIVQKRTNFVGKYLNAIESEIGDYVQWHVHRFLIELKGKHI